MVFLVVKFVFEANDANANILLLCATKQIKRSHYNDKHEEHRLVECENRFYMQSSYSYILRFSRQNHGCAGHIDVYCNIKYFLFSSVSPILLICMIIICH